MKTKELIRLLNQADPSGEEECVVANEDILNVQRIPAYYDGPAEVLIRRAHIEFPTAGKILRTPGNKVQITTLSLQDAATDFWEAGKEFPIEIVGDSTDGRYAGIVEQWKREAKK